MKLRKRQYRNGKWGWQIDYGIVDGKRKQVALDCLTKKDAETEFDKAVKNRRKTGHLSVHASPADLAELMVARQRLEGVPLMKAVEYYLQHARRVKKEVEVMAMIEPYLDGKPPEKLGKVWRSKLEGILEGLALALAPSRAHEVTQTQVERWLYGNGWKAKTRNNYLTEARALFKWGMHKDRGYLIEDPTEGIPHVDPGEEDIIAMTLPQTKALLNAAWHAPEQRELGFVVIGTFCGIRPEEMEKINYHEDVDLEGGTVVVRGPHAKTRKRRPVDLPENARLWLKDWQPVNSPWLVPRAHPYHWPRLREKAGWTIKRGSSNPWTRDIMRHTFASQHYALHQDETYLQSLMGHEDDDILWRHYRAMKTKKEAQEFWKLMPPQAA